MNTTNLISTPNIEGNIGSCTIQSNEIQIKGGLTRQWRSIQINSCNGHIVSEQTYSTYEGWWGIGIIAVLFIIIVICALNDY